ncbi:MAG: VPLPA-CTERM sorting domain-containing protein [Nitrospira sp.]|nr:VPLPA-CTERM sorting domain-containing protein [Nitrospira sp.]
MSRNRHRKPNIVIRGVAAALTAICAMSMSWVGNALAHVEYIVLTPGVPASDRMKRFGWIDGTDQDLGDSHQVSFFTFSLAESSLVDIHVYSTQNELGLNPAFTLYAGVLGQQAHDDTEIDPLNPVDSSFNKIPSPVDDGVTTDALGRVSPFRDTANIDFEGQFNALGSWSMASDPADGGVWRVLEYITHRNETLGNESLVDYLLGPGQYTIIASGAACNTSSASCTGPFITGTVLLTNIRPIPLPAAVYLFGAGLVGLAGVARRKKDA